MQRQDILSETEKKIVFDKTEESWISEDRADKPRQKDRIETSGIVNQNLFLEEWNRGTIEGIVGENQYTCLLYTSDAADD